MRYLLSIGSNCPSAAAMMARAEEWLRGHFANVESSGIYSSKALNASAPDYLNLVARGDSDMTPGQAIATAKAFEAECGRTAESKLRGSIEMDVDIIAAGDDILRPAELSRPYFITGLQLIDVWAKEYFSTQTMPSTSKISDGS